MPCEICRRMVRQKQPTETTMKMRFYLMEQKTDEFQTWLASCGYVTGYNTYSEAKEQAKKELKGRRRGQKVSVFERHETFQSPPSDIVSDDFNKPD
ncbi:hypothetical protein DB2_43 [Octadecabacter Antarctic DB virus 2]|nr:hypothetical protein DB2_43 [Octadecabacter Antarctic DB virus 2]